MRHVIRREVSFPASGVKLDPSLMADGNVALLATKSTHVLGASRSTRDQTESIETNGLDGPRHRNGDGPSSLKVCLPRARFVGAPDISFNGVASGSAECAAGQLVVYRVGKDDPVEVTADALARGAAGVLTEQLLPGPMPQCIVADTDSALSSIAIAQRGRPEDHLMLIGVVGSEGASVTAHCLKEVLRRSLDSDLRVSTWIDSELSDGTCHQLPSRKLTQAKDLIEHLQDAVDAGSQVAVVQLDAQMLRQTDCGCLHFDALVVAGRGDPSDDFGPSAAMVALERTDRNGMVVVSHDDARTIAMARDLDLQIVTYGVDVPAETHLQTVARTDEQLTAVLCHQDAAAMLECSIASGFAGSSIAAASAIANALSIPLTDIADAISQLKSLPGQMETIRGDVMHEGRVPRVVLDLGGCVERVRHSLKVLAGTMEHQGVADAKGNPIAIPIAVGRKARTRANRVPPKLWCVLAIGSDDPESDLEIYGRLLELLPDHAIVTCGDPERSDFLKQSHCVLDGVQDCAAMRLVADPSRAVHWAIHAANPQDTILIVGGLRDESPQRQLSRIESARESIQNAFQGRATPQTGNPGLRIVG
ncbi:MAG: UDP-N-acetylmuramoyl-L-alanyl-D-glutamate--2,6-diaminopimelate ligase [Planctomycetota bacterium]